MREIVNLVCKIKENNRRNSNIKVSIDENEIEDITIYDYKK